MATVIQTVREQAWLVEREPRSKFSFNTREVFLGNDTPTSKTSTVMRETAQLNDSTADKVTPMIHEVALVNETLTRSVTRTRILRETAQFKSRGVGGVRVTDVLREQALIADRTDYSIDGYAREQAKLVSFVSGSNTSVRTVREVVRSKSRIATNAGLNVHEVALLNDTTSERVRAVNTVRDVATLSSRDDTALRQANLLREVARVRDLYTIKLGRAVNVREKAWLSGDAVPPNYGRAYTCSIITWGMSVLTNFPFTTMAGKLVSHNNLWRWDANDDYGNPINWHILTGVYDFGGDQLKRLSAVYLSGSSESPLTVSVTGDVNGQRETYDYDCEMRDQDEYRNNRAIIGKGFRSRYVQVKIGATNTKARIINASADVAVSNRRV